jgi:hypothetical protein
MPGIASRFFPAAHMLRLKGGEEDQAPELTDSQKYDQALWDMLKQHPDEIFFLNTVFNFLQRRTPCFSGPNAERNYEILIDTLTRQKERYLEHIKKGKKPKAPVPMPDKSAPAPKAPSASAPLPARVLPPAQPTEPTEHGAGHTHGADDDCCREVVPAKKTEDSGAGKQVASLHLYYPRLRHEILPCLASNFALDPARHIVLL